MDPLETLLEELEGARRSALDLVRERMDHLKDTAEKALAQLVNAIEEARPSVEEELLPLEQIREHVAQARTRLEELESRVAEAEAKAAEAEQLRQKLEELESRPSEAGFAKPLELLKRLDKAKSQSELLRELLPALGSHVARAAVLVIREGKVSVWSGWGFQDPQKLRSWSADVEQSQALKSVTMDRSACRFRPSEDAVFSSWLDGEEPAQEAALIPVALRGKIVGAMYVDQVEGKPWDPEAAQFMTALTCLLIDTLSFRTETPIPPLTEFKEITGETPQEPEEESSQQVSQETPAVTVKVEAPVPPQEEPKEEPKETGDEAAHEEARRFARLLVSEIKLYNEQEVEQGRIHGDIYARLKDDIDRSREMYEQRVPAHVREAHDYFYEQLVEILAGGNPELLGM